REAILGPLTPIDGWERVAVRAALDRVLAENVIAPCNVPAHDNSAMDGYAIRFGDLEPDADTRLVVVGSAFAGRPFSGLIGAGQAVRIMTGAPIPEGADTTAPPAAARSEDKTVVTPARVRKGQNLRRAGEALKLGSIALPAGMICGPAEIGLIASLGIAEVTVRRRL